MLKPRAGLKQIYFLQFYKGGGGGESHEYMFPTGCSLFVPNLSEIKNCFVKSSLLVLKEIC